MKTVPCPSGDKGICTIPDSAIVAVQGTLHIVSREEIERHFPDFDVNAARLEPLNFTGSHEDLLEAAEALTMVLPRSEPVQELGRVVQESAGLASVIVTCSCGHIFGAVPHRAVAHSG
jgi:hypothetical protein